MRRAAAVPRVLTEFSQSSNAYTRITRAHINALETRGLCASGVSLDAEIFETSASDAARGLVDGALFEAIVLNRCLRAEKYI